jgi:type IV pilus assembly protein PilM
MSQKIIGIDLGTYSVKVVLLERQFGSYEVLGAFDHLLNLGSRLSHPEASVLALEQIMAAHPELEADVISLSLPGHVLSTRVLNLPVTNAKEIDQATQFELEAHVPFPIENLDIESHVLKKTEDETHALSLYVQSDILFDYLDRLENAGIDPRYVGADLIDLGSLAEVMMVPQEGYYAFLDIGHSKTSFLIMKDKHICYARVIGIGGGHFTRAVQRAFNLNFEKAEALKLSRGRLNVHEAESDQISRILEPVALDLVANIKQTMMGFHKIFGRQSVSSLFVTGGGSKLSGILDHLSFHLKTNVVEMEPLSLMTHHIEDPEEKNPTLAQALGSGVRPIFSNRLAKVNFRKGGFHYKKDILKLTGELKSMAFFLVFIIALAAGYYYLTDFHYTQKILAIDSKIERVVLEEFPDVKEASFARRRASDSSSVGRRLRGFKRAVVEKVNEVKSQFQSTVSGGAMDALMMMQLISENLPPKPDLIFEVSEFDYSSDFLRIKAHTDDPRNVENIVNSLKKSEQLAQIEVTDPQQRPNNEWEFTMKINSTDALEGDE